MQPLIRFSLFPGDILLTLIDWTQDPSNLGLVNKRLNQIANLWFERKNREILTQFPHFQRFLTARKSIVNFKLLFQQLQSIAQNYYNLPFPNIPSTELPSWAFKNFQHLLVKIEDAQGHRFQYSFDALYRVVNTLCHNAFPAHIHPIELASLLRQWKRLHEVNFQALSTLQLSGDRFFVIPDVITHISTLTQLQISETKVQRINPCLGKLKRLRKLKLESNQFLKNPSLFAFRSLTSLQVIDCPSVVNLKRISRLTNLRELILINSTPESPSFLTRCSNLKALRISDPSTRLLPTLSTMNFLRCLNLGESLDEELPLQITQLSFLRRLGLNNHSWTNLEALNTMTQLKSLSITANGGQAPLFSLERLTNLLHLRLENTRFYEFPVSITALTQLQTLHLGGNFISKVPNQLSLLTQLTYLDLSNNEIEDFPNVIQHFISLTELNLNYNNLTLVPSFLCLLPHLRKIALVGNRVLSIPSQVRRKANLQIECGSQQENSCQVM